MKIRTNTEISTFDTSISSKSLSNPTFPMYLKYNRVINIRDVDRENIYIIPINCI